MGEIITGGDKKVLTIPGQTKNLCQVCGQSHPPHAKCHHDALTRRIVKLVEANSVIPSVMAAAKEATELSKIYKNLFTTTQEAFSICEGYIKALPSGNSIWEGFENKLEETWETQRGEFASSNPGTEGPQAQGEQSTLSGTNAKPSTGEMTPGETTPPDSSKLTASATPVEKEQQL